jgi:cardiolipin synthase
MPTSPEVTLDSAIADWPWREGNQFNLLEATEQYFERMIQAIDDAQSYILLEMYLVESGVLAGRFIEAFSRAAQRGISVRLVLDGFGSLGLAQADRRLLIGAGVELRF